MGVRGYAWVCVGSRRYAWVCVGMRGCAWVRVGMRGCACVCVGVRGYAWVCVGMRGFLVFYKSGPIILHLNLGIIVDYKHAHCYVGTLIIH